MDYVFSIAFACFFALIYSVFTSFIASRSGRSIYRKIMWGYLSILVVAAAVITIAQLPPEWLIFGAVLTIPIAIFGQLGTAVTLGHLKTSSPLPAYQRDRYATRSTSTDDIRNSANPIHYGSHDPLRNW
ncbi:hypothetical protein MMZ06_27565 [Burkholderia gladioli]|uniref:hypothetical protein n=1 Tax=Burkholderia gladioli TaxID=28095 RepID=UPI0016412521|nr:hypothetical protein [Burkholderia gladioli]MBJ9711934.1 hypothetical protein [Burkholderia gladioli]MCH7273587.1 hypothetical protein [Burkholderia gladioli]MDZ4041571.1 hypothetical protein [Burkholderia gladioli pv. alliicola]